MRRGSTSHGLGLWLVFLVTSGPQGSEIVLIGTAQTLLLVLRHRAAPALVFTVVALACLAQLATRQPLISDVGFLVAVYALSAYGRDERLRWAGLGVGVLGGLLGAVVLLQVSPTPPCSSSPCWPGCPSWRGGGDLKRSGRRVLERLEEQNAALRRDRDQRAEIAAQAERKRIAREMHDIVAHSLSVVVVQADGGAYAAEHVPTRTRGAAVATFQTIGSAAGRPG